MIVLMFYEGVLVEDFEELFPAHVERVATDGTEDLQETGTLAVLGRSDVLEVVERPVHLVPVEMVDLHGEFSAIGCLVEGTRSNPRERHEDVAVDATEMPHDRILTTADAVG